MLESAEAGTPRLERQEKLRLRAGHLVGPPLEHRPRLHPGPRPCFCALPGSYLDPVQQLLDQLRAQIETSP